MIRFGSVCSGIEAASVAWNPLGWHAAWFSEIEPFPCAALAHHYPDVPNHGDMTTLPARIAAGEVDAPDVFCGGTPCQAFSVAGKRESLGDARGNLSLTFCEIANAIDDVRRARGDDECVVFWENVPGVLSTKDNAFGCFIAALAGCDTPIVAGRDGWTNAGVVAGPCRTVAWRVMDAQFFGLAQRRRRVFVVASARAGFDPAEVLLEFDGVRRDLAPRREAGEDASKCLTTGTGGRYDAETEDLVPVAHSLRGEGFDASEDGTGRGTPLVPVAFPSRLSGTQHASTEDLSPSLGALNPMGVLAFDTTQVTSATNRSNPKPGDPCHPLAAEGHAPAIAFSAKDHGADATADLSPTLRAMGHADSHANGGGQMAVAFQTRGSNLDVGDISGTMGANADRASGSAPMVAFQSATEFLPQSSLVYSESEVSPTLQSAGQRMGNRVPQVQAAMQVRRLTPVECERLQGFPDNYTRIPTWSGWRKLGDDETPEQLRAEGLEVKQNKKTGRWRVKDVDGPRYKAIGNSWAINNVRWIGRRMDAQLRALEAA